jgi:hypothetical protein
MGMVKSSTASIYVSLLVISRLCSLLIAKFSFAGMWKICCNVKAEGKHNAAFVPLKAQSGRQSLTGESSAKSSSGPSKFATYVTHVQSTHVRKYTTLK